MRNNPSQTNLMVPTYPEVVLPVIKYKKEKNKGDSTSNWVSNCNISSKGTIILQNRSILYIGRVKFSSNFCFAETISRVEQRL